MKINKLKYIISIILVLLTLFTIPVSAAIKGDIDSDGKISAADARLALRMSVGLEGLDMAADVDGDGKVSAADARLILRASVGLEEFVDDKPVEEPAKPEIKWENKNLGLKFYTSDFEVYQGDDMNTIVDTSLFESIDMSAEMMAINSDNTKTVTVITSTDSVFSAGLMTTAIKMMASSSEDIEYIGSGKENIAGKKYDLVSMKMKVGDDMVMCDYFIAEINKTLVMICITYPETETRTDIISCFVK